MTGGTVIVLGPTGRNFGAGMSGGIAYVYDPKQHFRQQCNIETLELESLKTADLKTIRDLISKHQEYTGSPIAGRLLMNWRTASKHFVKVMPTDYKRALANAQESANNRLDLAG
jgi:glutamate synthase (ferredoxin)